MIISTSKLNLEVILENDFIITVKQTVEPLEVLSPDQQTIAKQFNEYFDGKLTSFELEYDLHGSKLQLAVWKALSQVGYGETVSYSDLAEKAGYPKAIRAVATAVRQNPIPIVIPCHRVVRKSGDIGNYSLGGPEVKKYLLELESRA